MFLKLKISSLFYHDLLWNFSTFSNLSYDLLEIHSFSNILVYSLEFHGIFTLPLPILEFLLILTGGYELSFFDLVYFDVNLRLSLLDAFTFYGPWVSYFFFQAEDGIRDRSPSRGLGDVYKRQK